MKIEIDGNDIKKLEELRIQAAHELGVLNKAIYDYNHRNRDKERMEKEQLISKWLEIDDFDFPTGDDWYIDNFDPHIVFILECSSTILNKPSLKNILELNSFSYIEIKGSAINEDEAGVIVRYAYNIPEKYHEEWRSYKK